MLAASRRSPLVTLLRIAAGGLAFGGGKGASVIPTPLDLFQWLQTGGLLALMAVNIVALAKPWVITLSAHKAALHDRDERIRELVIENRTLRETTGRGLDRQDRFATTQETLAAALREIANAGKAP